MFPFLLSMASSYKWPFSQNMAVDFTTTNASYIIHSPSLTTYVPSYSFAIRETVKWFTEWFEVIAG